MRLRIPGIIAIAATAGALLPAQKQLSLPGAIGHVVTAGDAAPANDIASRYKNPREASIAALKAGNEAAAIARAPQRAMGLFLVAARRDPGFSAALYDLGVMCTLQDRWDDALGFYREVQLIDKSAEMTRLTNAEIVRVQLIASLEASPDGKRTRQFDINFVELTGRLKNPIVALEQASQLAKSDPGRWEAPAMIGIVQASLGRYEESAKALDAAISLAPADRRTSLISAAEIAKREAAFEDFVRTGDENFGRRQYDSAGKAYANAWETNPANETVGLRAATAFLMADQVSLAVQVLARLRATGSPAMSQKAAAMLTELAPVSNEAKVAAAAGGTGSREAAIPDVADRIRTVLGDLTSSEMRLAAQPAPPLLRDDTPFIAVPDEELTGNQSDLLLLSTQSVFQIYRKAVPVPQGALSPPDAPPSPDAAPVAPDGASPVPGHPPKFDPGTAAPKGATTQGAGPAAAAGSRRGPEWFRYPALDRGGLLVSS